MSQSNFDLWTKRRFLSNTGTWSFTALVRFIQKKGTFALNLLGFLQEMTWNGAQDSLHHGQMFFTVVGLNEEPV